jgi:glycosyltransferase involved in cell wall biosynthesis
MSEKITAAVITYNEESNIERCLNSLGWVDEIIVVDSYSQDKTVEICSKFKCKVIQTEWKGFGRTKKFAVDHSSNDWILSIDADEEVSQPLKNRIEQILEDPKYQGYNVKRRSFYMGREVKHCGWDNDYPLRLFNRNYGNFNEKDVHESVVLKGNRSKIEEPLLHYTYPSISSHISKMNRYTDISALSGTKLKKGGIIFSIAMGMNKFFKMYLLQKGFLDGKIGLLLSINSAFGVYLKYVKLWSKQI